MTASIHDAPQYTPAATPGETAGRDVIATWRRVITWALAAIWLIDAHLQFQAFMFTAGKNGFPDTAIAPTGQGSPVWISGPVNWATSLMNSDIGWWNFLFASAQLVIGLGLIWRRTTKPALAASIVWALLLWWMGEGLGGIFAGPVSPLMGLPGAAVIYALISILVWPTATRRAQSVADSGVLPAVVARVLWSVLWVLFAWESLRAANRARSALHDMVAGMVAGEPGWIRSLDSWGADVLGNRGLFFSILTAAIFVLAAVAPWVSRQVPSAVRGVLGVVIVLAVLIWVFGEDFGGIATGTATDVNSGPLLILLALAYWPVRAAASPAVTTS